MGRTPEEREAARLEREHRRAQRPDGESPLAASESVDPAPDHDGDQVDGDEPIGVKRVSRLSTEPASPRKREPVRKARRPRRRVTSVRGRIVAVVALVLGVAVLWFLYELFQPFHGSGHGRVTVTIPQHSSVNHVADLLEHEGVISSAFFFELRATLDGERSHLRAGTYRLKLDMSYGDVLKVLTTAPPAARVTALTLVEGRTRKQIDRLLRSQGVRGSYLVDTRHSKLLDPHRYGAPRSTPDLEGFLFPSTYQVREPIGIAALVSDQLKTFRARFAHVNLSYARGKHLTPYDVLVIASMVEAEAQTQHDRPLIASVIYNRLARGMPLQIDATTRYATGNYTKPLTVSELNSRSRFNTRIHKGLPPTPIDNPGMASIQAAAHPAHTNYLYFVVKPCGNGEQAFTGNYQQFLKLQQQYQAARARRGGSPSHC